VINGRGGGGDRRDLNQTKGLCRYSAKDTTSLKLSIHSRTRGPNGPSQKKTVVTQQRKTRNVKQPTASPQFLTPSKTKSFHRGSITREKKTTGQLHMASDEKSNRSKGQKSNPRLRPAAGKGTRKDEQTRAASQRRKHMIKMGGQIGLSSGGKNSVEAKLEATLTEKPAQHGLQKTTQPGQRTTKVPAPRLQRKSPSKGGSITSNNHLSQSQQTGE